MTFQRTRILDVDLADPLPGHWEASGHARALVLVRWHRAPVGVVEVPCDADGRLSGAAVRAAAGASAGILAALSRRAVARWLLGDEPEASGAGPGPTWSVVVCTRDRAEDLARCLDALGALEAPPGAPAGEVVVVDNAPSDDRAARVVEAFVARGTAAARGVPVRYVREDRPGLNWARARGARVASGEIVAYTDDDVVVDPRWITRIVAPFADTRVGAVTGLTMPLELETEAQWLFERYGGFGRGFERRVFEAEQLPPAGAGSTGAGANMAFRRAIVVQRGLFDVELDAGTVTLTGGDTWALSRILDGGWQIVYTPDALVWHRHRRERDQLRRTLYGYSVGGFAFLTRRLVERGDWGAVRVALRWLRSDHLRLAVRAARGRSDALPWDLVRTYWRGVPVGPVAYFRSRRRERRHLREDGRDRAVAPPRPEVA